VGIVLAIWNWFLSTWIHIGIRLFPPTVHPMLVHFPIVLLYGSLFMELLGRIIHPQDRFYDRISFWLLILAFFAGVATAATGVISEQFVRWSPTTAALLSAHQRDAVLTGLLVLMTLGARLLGRYAPVGRRTAYAAGSGWSAWGTGRGRPTALSFLLLIGAVAMITVTASIGGTMVYHYGVGIRGVTFRLPPGAP
jgi:uncharacterized membrane protein